MNKRKSKTANHARNFNAYMHNANEIWAADVLGMNVNPEDGPDLIDNRKIVEVKFTLVSPRKYPEAWTVLEHQMNYPQDCNKTGFWGLGKYWLKIPVREIHEKIHERLEEFVEKRELFIVQWDWMYHFLPSRTNGKTNLSEWSNTLRYPKFSYLPDTIKTYQVKGGLVHLTHKVQIRHFSPDINKYF